jgi:voltage-gated potassium channel
LNVNEKIIVPPGDSSDPNDPGGDGIREKLFTIIFGSDTPAGKAFDLFLIVMIVLSVIAVMLDTVARIHDRYGELLYIAEWFFTIIFTIEYLVRLWVVKSPRRYATSFFGLVDLLSIVPTYLSLIFTGAQYLLVIRVLRILRVFRVLKLARYMGEADALMQALKNGRRKILVFLYTILTLVVVFGALMYLIEGAENGFTSIPRGVYWAIVTLTTVGYGDMSPVTPLGQTLASVIMIMGYGIIAVPTGIYAAELSHVIRQARSLHACGSCGAGGHDNDATFCRVCGGRL